MIWILGRPKIFFYLFMFSVSWTAAASAGEIIGNATACPNLESTRIKKIDKPGEVTTNISNEFYLDAVRSIALPNTDPVYAGKAPTVEVCSPAQWMEHADNVLWPFLAFISLLFLSYKTKLLEGIAGLLSGITIVKAGAVEFEISQSRALKVSASFHESYRDFCKITDLEYDRQARGKELQRLLHNAVEEIKKKANLKYPCRATVHVPDVVFQNFLYQLLNYFPNGEGRGRRFSIRYGIIGRSWRTKKSFGYNSAFGHTTSDDRATKIEKLVSEWGMIYEEAEQLEGLRPSLLSIILRPKTAEDEDVLPVGILYLDCEHPDAFEDDSTAQALAQELEKTPAVVSLTEAVKVAMASLRERGTFLEI